MAVYQFPEAQYYHYFPPIKQTMTFQFILLSILMNNSINMFQKFT